MSTYMTTSLQLRYDYKNIILPELNMYKTFTFHSLSKKTSDSYFEYTVFPKP